MFYAKLKSNAASVKFEFDKMIYAKFLPIYPQQINLLTSKLKQEQMRKLRHQIQGWKESEKWNLIGVNYLTKPEGAVRVGGWYQI